MDKKVLKGIDMKSRILEIVGAFIVLMICFFICTIAAWLIQYN